MCTTNTGKRRENITTRKGTATSIKIGILHRQLSVTSMTVFSLFVIW